MAQLEGFGWAQLEGFGCKITAGGKASLFVEKRFANSKNIRKTIGNYHGLDRRSAATRPNRVDVSKDKRNILARHQAALGARRRWRIGMGCASRQLMAHRSAKSSGKLLNIGLWIASILGNAPPSEISKADIKTLLVRLAKSPQCVTSPCPHFSNLRRTMTSPRLAM